MKEKANCEALDRVRRECLTSTIVGDSHIWLCEIQIGEEARRRGSSQASKWTVNRTLARSNYFKAVPVKIPMMTDTHMRNRVAWCNRYMDFNFDNVIFSDESRFQFYRVTRKRWAKNGKCSKMVPKFSPAVTVWGGISKMGVTPLIFVKGNINSIKYCEILEEGLLQSDIVESDLPFKFQQNNARPHTSTDTRTWFQDNFVTVIDWPAASPDLNPIENVWQVIKDKVEKLEPVSINDWRTTIQQTWASLDDLYLDNLIDSMPRRLEQCVRRNGALTDY